LRPFQTTEKAGDDIINASRGAGSFSWLAPDVIVLTAFVPLKWQSDPLIVIIAPSGMTAAFLLRCVFLALPPPREAHGEHTAVQEKHDPVS